MRIIEQFVRGKHDDDSLCEDGVYSGPGFVAVVDGATDKSGTRYSGATSGRIVRDIVLKGLADAQPEWSATEMFATLNSRVLEWYRRHGIAEQVRTEVAERAGACVVIYSSFYNQVWMVGDCIARTSGRVFSNEKSSDSLLSDVRAFVLESARTGGASEEDLSRRDPGREAILPLLETQFKFQNDASKSRFSYYVLDGFLPVENGVTVVDLPSDTDELVLASDGYPEVCMSLEESEQKLTRVLAEDPLLYRTTRSTKGKYDGQISFDDRAYVRIGIDAASRGATGSMTKAVRTND